MEGRANADHFNARDGHDIQRRTEAILSALHVVELKRRYTLCNDLGVCIRPVGSLNVYQEPEGEGWPTDKARALLSNAIGVAANDEGNDATQRYDGVRLAEA